MSTTSVQEAHHCGFCLLQQVKSGVLRAFDRWLTGRTPSEQLALSLRINLNDPQTAIACNISMPRPNPAQEKGDCSSDPVLVDPAFLDLTTLPQRASAEGVSHPVMSELSLIREQKLHTGPIRHYSLTICAEHSTSNQNSFSL